MTNRIIKPKELYDMLCQDRQIVNKNNQGFADPVVKKRHDEIDTMRELANIDKEYNNININD